MSQQYKLKGLREKHANCLMRIRAIGEKTAREERAMNDSERVEFENLKAESVSVAEQIRAVEADQAAIADAAVDLPAARTADPGRGDVRHDPNAPAGRRDKPTAEDRATALQAWCRSQYGIPLKKRHVAACRRLGFNPRAKNFDFRLDTRSRQQRALTTTGATTGATLIPEGFGPSLERALSAFGGVREVADVIRTTSGNSMPWPTGDDTSNTGELLAENTEVAYADPAFSAVTFSAYKFSSKGIKVPFELLEDNAINLESLLGEMIGERLGRIQGTYFTTGTGTGQPQGVVTGASAGITAAGAAAIVGTEIVRLYHSINPAYRNPGPQFGYMCNDGVLAALAILVDGNSQPLFQASFREGQPHMFYGQKVFINQHMQATLATATVTVLCGDFSAYKVRDVGVVRLKRLEERWAELDQVGFLGFLRSDGRYINTARVKKLTQA
jgi:HK97 family phage major capsid protein